MQVWRNAFGLLTATNRQALEQLGLQHIEAIKIGHQTFYQEKRPKKKKGGKKK
jgi:hypothetical protein